MWYVCWFVVVPFSVFPNCCNKRAQRPHNSTLYDELHGCSTFHVTRKDLGSSLNMAQGCRNMLRKWYYNKPAQRPHNSTLYDELHGCSTFHVTRKYLGSSLNMAQGCRNMLRKWYYNKPAQ